MPNEKPDAEQALQKLGQRLRQGMAEKHPTQEKDVQKIKDAVREQYEQGLQAENEKKPERQAEREKEQQRKPSDPEQER